MEPWRALHTSAQQAWRSGQVEAAYEHFVAAASALIQHLDDDLEQPALPRQPLDVSPDAAAHEHLEAREEGLAVASALYCCASACQLRMHKPSEAYTTASVAVRVAAGLPFPYQAAAHVAVLEALAGLPSVQAAAASESPSELMREWGRAVLDQHFAVHTEQGGDATSCLFLEAVRAVYEEGDTQPAPRVAPRVYDAITAHLTAALVGAISGANAARLSQLRRAVAASSHAETAADICKKQEGDVAAAAAACSGLWGLLDHNGTAGAAGDTAGTAGGTAGTASSSSGSRGGPGVDHGVGLRSNSAPGTAAAAGGGLGPGPCAPRPMSLSEVYAHPAVVTCMRASGWHRRPEGILLALLVGGRARACT